jgi:hypothetical protein
MFICIHECRYVLITQYFYGLLTNQEMGEQKIKKWRPDLNCVFLYMCTISLVKIV